MGGSSSAASSRRSRCPAASSRAAATNLVNGKQQFVEQCAALPHARARRSDGRHGPNLDEAFRSRAQDGLGESTFAGVVHGQILHPNRNAQVDPATGKPLPLMPARHRQGRRRARRRRLRRPGRRRLGRGHRQARRRRRLQGRGHRRRPRTARSTSRSPPPGLAYKFADAEAPAGSVKIKSENPQSAEHDIAIEGNGADSKGEIVDQGGTSRVHRRPQARRVHVLLHRARPPRRWHGRQAHRQVGRSAECARASRRGAAPRRRELASARWAARAPG